MRTLLVNGMERRKLTAPRNILIQSVAGGGKSTLCNRLAYLWANNSAEIQRLDNFDLVFLIKVNLIQPDDKSIYDYINNELLSDVDNICDAINNSRMLFIVDGYDELRGKKSVVEDLLAKHVCPQSTVILTTRYGQTPALKYFSNGFGITSLSSDDVSSRTSLFTHIVDGILLKASKRLKKTEAECKEAVEMLEEIAYKCLCNNKLHFDKPLSDLSANIGLVKQTKSHLKLKLHTTYTFTHKSLAEYLTARYIVKQTGRQLKARLSKVPEVRSAKRRQASLILIFVCGLLTDEEQLMSLCESFFSKVTSEDSHSKHLALECAAELDMSESLAYVMKKRVCKEVRCEEECNQYCALGIKKLYE